MIIKYLLIGGIFLLVGISLSAQNNDFTYQYFGVEDGLPSSRIRCLFKDSRDLLWVGTTDTGLCLFDGTKFHTYPLVNSNKKSSAFNGTINAITEDNLGRLWVATNIGIYIVSLEERTVFLLSLPKEQAKSSIVISLCKMSDGTIWASTIGDKIAIIDSRLEMRWIEVKGANAPDQIVEDNVGNIWLTKAKEGELIFKVDANGILLDSIKRELGEYLYLFKKPNKSILAYFAFHEKLLILDETNNEFIFYQNPFYQTDKMASFDFIPKESIFPLSYLVRNFLFEDTGTIWIATTEGLFAFSEKNKKTPFYTIPELKGKSLRVIQKTEEDLFHVSANGLYEWNRKTGDLNLLCPNLGITTYLPFSGDSILLRTTFLNFYLFNKSTKECNLFQPKIENNLLFSEDSYFGIKDRNGLIRSGAYYFNGLDSLVALKNCLGEMPLNNKIVFSILEDQRGLIWMGTNDGLFKIDSCEISHIPIETPFDFFKVNVIFEINEDELFIGTKNQGLFRFHKEKGVTAILNKQNGLSDNRIATIESNDEKGVWVATFNGLNYIDLSTHHIQSFFESDGLAHNEFNSYSSCKLENGDLLFGGMNGCTVVPKDLELTQVYLPDLRVNSYSKINKSTQQFDKFFIGIDNQKVTLKPDEVYVEFDFGSSDLLHQNRASFAYLLEGIDEDWIYAKDEKTVRYTNLAAGTYYFKTKMKVPSGDWIFAKNQVELEVQQYFYESNWFIGLIVLLIFSFLYGNLWYRWKQGQRLERVRQKLAYDLHDDVGSTLNGIYQIITGIKRQKIPLDSMEAELNKITKLSDDVVKNMNDVIWSIGTKLSSFEDLLTRIQDFADDVFPAANMSYHIDCQGINLNTKINFNIRYHLLLIVKEGFNNAIKHSGGGRVDLILRERNGSFSLELINKFDNLKESENSSNRGLKSIRHRAKSINATVDFKQELTHFSIHLKMKSFLKK